MKTAYDRAPSGPLSHPEDAKLRRLWRLCTPVRTEQETLGCPQELLKGGWDGEGRSQEHMHPLNVEGVIYAIFSRRNGKCYVGQTIHSSLDRLRGHVHAARQPGSSENRKPLYDAMRRRGLDQFFIFVLEKIHWTRPTGGTASLALKRFTQQATPREIFWIDRLRAWRPRGYNTQYAARSRLPCRHRRNNPMARHRHRNPHPNPAPITLHTQRVFGCRNWERRLMFLVQMYTSSRWQLINFTRYKYHTLRKLINHLAQRLSLDLLEIAGTAIPEPTLRTILARLRAAGSFVYSRTAKQQKVTNPLPFRILWHNSAFQHIPLLRILKSAEGWPTAIGPEVKERFLVCKQLVPTVGYRVCNFRKAAQTCNEYTPPDESCPCRRAFGPAFRPNDGCVLTMDLDIVRHPDLQQLMRQGAKFRENFRVDAAKVISDSVLQFTHSCASKFDIDPQLFTEWSANVRAAVVNQLPPPFSSGSVLDRSDVQRALTRLRRLLVISVTDKADKNFTLVCKNFYKYTLIQELQTQGGAYEPVNLTAQQIYERYSTQLLAGKCPTLVRSKLLDACRRREFRLPLLYWLPKMHKSPPKARFIAASSNVMTTPLAQALTPMLVLIRNQLKARDQQHLTDTGVSRCWFVNGYDEVAQRIRHQPGPLDHQQSSLNTFDFSTMYTALDLSDVEHCLHVAIHEAFGTSHDHPHHQYLVYNGPRRPATWFDPHSLRRPNPSDATYYTPSEVSRLIKVLIQNTFIKNGDSILRQSKGIPMGTNPGPQIADLTCFTYEATAMDDLMFDDLQKARCFSQTLRYIDDILSRNNPHFEEFVTVNGSDAVARPIYPPSLTLNKTTDSPWAVDFLGMQLRRSNHSVIIRVASSKKRFPVPKIDYPSLLGNFPKSAAYGVVTGQLHRFSRICTTARDFLAHSLDLCVSLLPKGYSRRRLHSCFVGFLRSSNPYKTRPSTLARTFFRDLFASP